jgi:addiction module HigA family antidote
MTATSQHLPIHPGEHILEEMLARKLSVDDMATAMEWDSWPLCGLLDGEIDITADIARRLSGVFGTTADFWLNLQASFEASLLEWAPQIDWAEKKKRRDALVSKGLSSLSKPENAEFSKLANELFLYKQANRIWATRAARKLTPEVFLSVLPLRPKPSE